MTVPQESARPRLSVVVPVWNEAENIEPLVREIAHALEGAFDYEIVYVDDGSDDATPERLAALAREMPRLRIVRHPQRRGQSAALWTGIRAAHGEWVATLDGDGQNDPRDIPRLWQILQQARDSRLRLVTGERRERHDTWIKRMGSRIANAVRAWLLRDRTPDTGCGLKLVHRETFLAVPAFDHMHRFLPALVLREGYEVLSVPVRHRPRARGRSKYGVLDRLWIGIVDLAGVWWLMRRPLRRPDETDTQG